MKTLSGTFRLIVLGVVVIVAVASCCTYDFVNPGTIVPGTRSFAFVDIGGKQKGPAYAPTYVEWKSEQKFNDALAQIRSHQDKGAEYCVCIKKPGHDPYKDPYSKCGTGYECPPGDIKTVKVTKSKAADNIVAGESVANDPNVMHRVQSPYPGDIIKVLNALQ